MNWGFHDNRFPELCSGKSFIFAKAYFSDFIVSSVLIEACRRTVKLQSLTEQLVNLRKKMYGQSSEKVQYVSGEQLSMYQDFFNEAETYSNASAPEPGKTTPVKAHERMSARASVPKKN